MKTIFSFSKQKLHWCERHLSCSLNIWPCQNFASLSLATKYTRLPFNAGYKTTSPNWPVWRRPPTSVRSVKEYERQVGAGEESAGKTIFKVIVYLRGRGNDWGVPQYVMNVWLRIDASPLGGPTLSHVPL